MTAAGVTSGNEVLSLLNSHRVKEPAPGQKQPALHLAVRAFARFVAAR